MCRASTSPCGGGAWELAPAYDLTGGDFPSADPWRAHAGVHQLSVNGRRRDVTEDDLLAVADRFGFGTAELDEYLCKYEKAGFPPVSHSEAYRQAYKPSYRIIRI